MKWSMDTHKYMSETTRKALQIMTSHGITSESEPEEIELVEKELAAAGVYKDYESARGRVRRALFTYFKAYGCLDENETLTEIGRLFADNRLSLREFSFYYVLNYYYKDEEAEYYPAQLVLKCLKIIHEIVPEQSYLTPYDFSKLVDCDSETDVTEDFIASLVETRSSDESKVNERAIGFDVWAKMLVQSGILKRDENRNLVACNYELIDWILEAYEEQPMTVMGSACTGILKSIPVLPVVKTEQDATSYRDEGRALQAFLFDAVNGYIIEKYIYKNSEDSFKEMINALGIIQTSKGYYNNFAGVERIIGLSLMDNDDTQIRMIGEIIASAELNEYELQGIAGEIQSDYASDERICGGRNMLLYGVPGSGKSFEIKDNYCKDEEYAERVVFHPDYTYSDFVGQILPTLNAEKRLEYRFTPGPFTKILKRAWCDPKNMYYLIIEELNRGNAPAIFGEIFQLLDRKKEGEYPSEVVGESEYSIYNADISNEVYGYSDHKIRIPSNMSILSTMNTSDQNVFTLDTAFQRRWNTVHIRNDVLKSNISSAKIEGTDIEWGTFADQINKAILKSNEDIAGSEDKRLGAYFVSREELEPVRFSEKVLKYLWDDAFKMDHDAIFKDELKSLDIVLESYQQSKTDKLEAVLRRSFYKEILDAMGKKNGDSEAGNDQTVDEKEDGE